MVKEYEQGSGFRRVDVVVYEDRERHRLPEPPHRKPLEVSSTRVMQR
jgi:hypothetical protein